MRNVQSEVIFELLDFLVKQKDEGSLISYSAIKNALYSFSIPFAFTVIPKGTPLFRIRVHKNYFDNLEASVYNEIREVGHRYDYNNILTFGRANEPLQTIFYCSTERKTAFFETSQIARLNSNSEKEIYSIGRWIVKEDLRVATFPINNLNRNKNRIAEDLNKRFEELVGEFHNKETIDLLNLLYFLSTEFARDYHREKDYLISSAFANYVYDHPGIDLKTNKEIQMDGIMYPSVQWSECGMNLALTPNVVNHRLIDLDQVDCQKMEQVDKTVYKVTEMLISKSIDYENWKIIWK